MKLVVGLGNPGRKYQATRHNAGFWWVERLAERVGVGLRAEGRFQGLAGRLSPPNGNAWLLLPETFMNHSGRAVAALASFYRIQPADILVVHDELDLPPGTVKLKKGGGTGGHNGLKDMQAQLGSAEFWRLRLGIGHPGQKEAVAGFVLRRAPALEREQLQDCINKSLLALPLVLEGDMDRGLQKLHAKPQRPKPPKLPPQPKPMTLDPAS